MNFIVHETDPRHLSTISVDESSGFDDGNPASHNRDLERLIKMSRKSSVKLPTNCPYSIRKLCSDDFTDLYLIREHDHYGEFPNIYVNCMWPCEEVLRTDNIGPSRIILSDVGTGLNEERLPSREDDNEDEDFQHVASPDQSRAQVPKRYWNIATVLEYTVNPNHKAPYWILTTHFHYDHILGYRNFRDSRITLKVFGSELGQNFYSPWQALQKNSLCEKLGLEAPRYKMIYPCKDGHSLETADREGTITAQSMLSGLSVLLTPGHTPDSLSWYLSDLRILCVGDMFYERESEDTRTGSHGRWTAESSAAVVFVEQSNINHWRQSMHKILSFVQARNAELPELSKGAEDLTSLDSTEYLASDLDEEDWLIPGKTRVKLCAAHVTVSTDAELAIIDMLAFMDRIQRGKVPKHRISNHYTDEKIYLWEEKKDENDLSKGRYSVISPHRILFPGADR